MRFIFKERENKPITMIIKGTNLFLWIGPVRAGKTTKLHEVIAKSDEETRILYVNSSVDIRTQNEMSTHNCVIKQAETPNVTYLKTDRLRDVETVGYRKLLIDEGQFFPDLVEMVEEWYNLGLLDEIHIAGLDTTWERKPFLDQYGRWQILHLMPIATKVEKITARCKACRDENKRFGINADVDAPFSGWVKTGVDTQNSMNSRNGIKNVDVSGQYIPLCPFHWNEFMKYDRVYPIPSQLSLIEQTSLRRVGSEYADDDEITESSETDSNDADDERNDEENENDEENVEGIKDLIRGLIPIEYQDKIFRAIESVRKISVPNHIPFLEEEEE